MHSKNSLRSFIRDATSPLRSRIMAAVQRRHTAPELRLRQALTSSGLRYRVNGRCGLPGSPDVWFPGPRVAVFVDGCFWHGCPIHGTEPKSNAAFWQAKIQRNRERDQAVDIRLEAMGWIVVRIWEHEVKSDAEAIALRIWAAVRSC
jgi:DNA mismatch endonuclease, patch repair protein